MIRHHAKPRAAGLELYGESSRLLHLHGSTSLGAGVSLPVDYSLVWIEASEGFIFGVKGRRRNWICLEEIGYPRAGIREWIFLNDSVEIE
jgi:hypothetical protein